MGILSDPLNLVLLGVVAFVGYRLWLVLGSRTGFERAPQPQPIHTEPKSSDLELKVNPTPAKPVWEGYAEENSPLAKGLTDIAEADATFSPSGFIGGAKVAHERILEAFAKSDLATLKFLLTKSPLATFETEIDRRKKDGETTIFKFVGVNAAKIMSAKLTGKKAVVDVKFDSQMISAVKNKLGSVITGDERKVTDIRELWSFERDTTSTDPNWKLAETHDHE